MLAVCFLFIVTVRATNEWNCESSSNAGAFERSSNCTITGSSYVDVSSSLEINGTIKDMNNLVTIKAASNQRHFYINNINGKLTLRYVKLRGGDTSNNNDNPAQLGGSILIFSNGGHLRLHSSILYDNKARYGGGIACESSTSTIYISDSHFHKNEATQHGGGAHLGAHGSSTIVNTSWTLNTAIGHGGAVIVENKHRLTLDHNFISTNTAQSHGTIYRDERVWKTLQQCQWC